MKDRSRSLRNDIDISLRARDDTYLADRIKAGVVRENHYACGGFGMSDRIEPVFKRSARFDEVRLNGIDG